MTPEQRAWLADYRPYLTSDEAWEAIEPTLVDWVTQIDPAGDLRVPVITKALSNFLVWAYSEGLPFDAAVLFTVERINWYLSSLSVAESSIATTRSYLVSAAKTLNPTAWVDTVKFSRPRVKDPYTAAEVAGIVAAIEAVPDYRRAQLRLLVALCLGCGFDGRDIAWLGPDALEVDGAGVHVTVEGSRARTVTCLAGVEDILVLFWNDWARMRRLGPDEVPVRLFGKANNRKARSETTSRITKHVRLANGDLLHAGRLRAMWILHMLDSVVPITVLCNQAHISPGSSFSDYVDLIAPPDPALAVVFVRHAHPAHGDTIEPALETWRDIAATAPAATTAAAARTTAAAATTAPTAATAPAAATTTGDGHGNEQKGATGGGVS